MAYVGWWWFSDDAEDTMSEAKASGQGRAPTSGVDAKPTGASWNPSGPRKNGGRSDSTPSDPGGGWSYTPETRFPDGTTVTGTRVRRGVTEDGRRVGRPTETTYRDPDVEEETTVTRRPRSTGMDPGYTRRLEHERAQEATSLQRSYDPKLPRNPTPAERAQDPRAYELRDRREATRQRWRAADNRLDSSREASERRNAEAKERREREKREREERRQRDREAREARDRAEREAREASNRGSGRDWFGDPYFAPPSSTHLEPTYEETVRAEHQKMEEARQRDKQWQDAVAASHVRPILDQLTAGVPTVPTVSSPITPPPQIVTPLKQQPISISSKGGTFGKAAAAKAAAAYAMGLRDYTTPVGTGLFLLGILAVTAYLAND